MKIVQVVSGYLPLDPTENRRWGAMETVMIEYQKKLTELGHEVCFKYLNDVQVGEQDIVHIHVANLCVEAHKRGIPYIYSNHDHTSCYLGKNSTLYEQQQQAINGSVFSICHAESVLSFFNSDKLFYLPHGVDTNFYTANPITEILEDIKPTLFMCATNGIAGDYTYDRKGFKIGIEAAEKLGLNIVIIGSEANARFFDAHKDLLSYGKLHVDSSNVTDAVKLQYFKDADIFLNPSSIEFGDPNLSMLESVSCCIPLVSAYSGSKRIEGLFKLDELTVDNLITHIQSAISYIKEGKRINMMEQRSQYDWTHVVKKLEPMYHAVSIPVETKSKNIKQRYLSVYGI